jgi:hypothetical protein
MPFGDVRAHGIIVCSTAVTQEITPMTKTTSRQWLSAAAALIVTATAAAQQQPPDFSKVEIKTTRLAPDFYTLEGSAC